jgi:hypothetical protein
VDPPSGWHSPILLADRGARAHARGMFVVSEAEAATIRAIFDQRGELSAAVELRRLFPAITDNVQARECARTIAGRCRCCPVRRSPSDRARRASLIPRTRHQRRPNGEGRCHSTKALRNR